RPRRVAPLPYYLQEIAGGVYSGYPSGMVPFALPAAALARLTGADLRAAPVHERLEKWTAAWLAAGCLGLFFVTALHLAAPAPAWAAAALLAAGSVMWTTVGQGLWQQGGIVLAALVLVLVEFRRQAGPARGGLPLQAAACALAL